MNNREWTAQEDKYIMANWHKRTDAEMALKLDRTEKAVTKRRQDLGVTKRTSVHWSDAEIQTLCKHHDKPLKELSAMLGKHPKAVDAYKWRLREKWGKDWHNTLMTKPTTRWQPSYITAEIEPELKLAVRLQQLLRGI